MANVTDRLYEPSTLLETQALTHKHVNITAVSSYRGYGVHCVGYQDQQSPLAWIHDRNAFRHTNEGIDPTKRGIQLPISNFVQRPER